MSLSVPVEVLVLLGPSPWEGPLVAGLAHPASRVEIARRCLDTADLLAAASAGLGRVAVLGALAPRLDADVVERVRAMDVAVVGVVGDGDDEGARRLSRWGASAVVMVDPIDLGRAVREIASAASSTGSSTPMVGEESGADAADVDGGRVIAVWGPAGAPGRTSVAVALADESARAGADVLLVDADTWAPSVSVVLGLLDDGAGLASACRRSLGGGLDVAALTALARQVHPGLRVLPGLPRSGRWNEVRGAAIADVLRVARSLADLVVVDCGFSLEADEELVFDTEAPRRNAATFAALESADLVVAVGSADPVGLVRIVAGLSELGEVVPGSDVRVLVTRLRESLVGRRGAAAVADALHRHAGVDDVWCVPDDRAAYDEAVRRGATLAEVAPSSPARAALRSAANELLRDLGVRGPQRLAAGQRTR
ncbi:MAG TPA: chromosome partitioning protein [Candidatus Angelobacter sp.]|nr:chromosome partitioning protein [Candidatus Angelobacter sp.]